MPTSILHLNCRPRPILHELGCQYLSEAALYKADIHHRPPVCMCSLRDEKTPSYVKPYQRLTLSISLNSENFFLSKNISYPPKKQLTKYFVNDLTSSSGIRETIPVPLRRVRTTRSSTHSHPFKVPLPNPRTLSHKSSFIPTT